MTTPRSLKPRASIVTAPLLVSQLNCLQLAGIDPRRFLDLVRERKLRHGRVGKLVIVDAELLRETLAAAAVNQVDNGKLDSSHDDGPGDVDDVLALVGKRRAAR